MDIQWMKRVDGLAGKPICGALGLYEKSLGKSRGKAIHGYDSPPASLAGKPSPRIGVIKFWGMGSLILAAPMFHALRVGFPRAEIHLITLAQNKGILDLLGLADKTHFLTLPGSVPAIGSNIVSLFSRVGEIGLDAVIDLEYLSRFSAIVCYMTGAPIRVGFHSWDVRRGNLHTVRRAFNPYWHVTDNFLNLQAALGGEQAPVEPIGIEPDPEAREGAERLLRAAGVEDGERLIAVNPNASTMALARRWPEDYFVDMADGLIEKKLGRVVLLGAPEEAAYVEKVAQRIGKKRVVNVAGKSTLSDLVGLLARTSLLITNDSGPLHLANALGTPTVSFFGPETPVLFGPRGKNNVVLYKGIDCSPCINIYNAKTVRCTRERPECLASITADEALVAAQRSLESNG